MHCGGFFNMLDMVQPAVSNNGWEDLNSVLAVIPRLFILVNGGGSCEIALAKK